MNVDLDALDKTDCHFWLTQGMARTIGVSITDEIAKGTLTAAEFGTMVERCQRCEHAEPCVRWMAEGGKGTFPAYCLNHETIETLKALKDG